MLSDGLDVGSRRQRRRHVPRQQLVGAVEQMVSDSLDNIGEIRLGIKAVQRAVPIKLYIAAARSPPESAPANK